MGVADHRGRMQAQGQGVEESVSWVEEEPPTRQDGHDFLDELEALLQPAERNHRELAFLEAHRHVERSAQAGGMPFGKKSFPQPSRRDGRRVDIEVQKGIAFVPDDQE